jgi:predicted dinucleotide-binding enzyme
MRIGILGTGNVARALAAGWSAAGHDLVLGSRRPQDRKELDVTVVGLGEAAAHAEVVVNATPGTVSVGVLATIGASALAGKTLVDVGVGLSDDFTELGSVLGRDQSSSFACTAGSGQVDLLG